MEFICFRHTTGRTGMGNKLKRYKFIKQTVGLFLVTTMALTSPGALAAKSPVRDLIPMGNAVGINLKTEGVMVVGLAELTSENGSSAPARDAGIIPGDVITKINTTLINSGDDIKNIMTELDGSPISLKVIRNEKALQFTLKPNKNADGTFELGLWLRDNMAGIGTMTFYDPETGIFGALGHAINDVDTGVLIPLREGSVMRSSITDIIPGQAGSPGQLLGTFNVEDGIGSLTTNTTDGIFGLMEVDDLVKSKKTMPAALESEITLGEATILSNISGSNVQEYTVEITRLYTGDEANGRSMMLTVTDQTLLDQTGGIVQGMSGSPIIQNGKLVGAVTHVLINNPSKGYGISIERMLDTAYCDKKSMAA